jgi:hypothetical protein
MIVIQPSRQLLALVHRKIQLEFEDASSARVGPPGPFASLHQVVRKGPGPGCAIKELPKLP